MATWRLAFNNDLTLSYLYLFILCSWLWYKCIWISTFLYSILIKWLECLMIISHCTLVIFIHCITSCLYVIKVWSSMWLSFVFNRYCLLLWESLNNAIDKLSCLLMHTFTALLSIHLTHWLHVIRERWFRSAICGIYIESIVDRTNTIWRKVSRRGSLLLLYLLRLTSVFEETG